MHNKLLQLVKDNFKQSGDPKITVKNADSSNPTIFIYDVIDNYFGVSAEEFNKTLIDLENKTINLRIDSPGGDVFAAEAMATFIKQHGDVHAFIDGHAASAATRLAVASNDIQIAENGFYMVHNSWTWSVGNKHELAQTIELLDKIDQGIISNYEKQTGKSRDQIVTWMDEETWFSADDAVELGFVSGKIDDGNPHEAKNWNLSAYKNAPKQPNPTQDQQPDDEIAKALQAQHTLNQNRLKLLNI